MNIILFCFACRRLRCRMHSLQKFQLIQIWELRYDHSLENYFTRMHTLINFDEIHFEDYWGNISLLDWLILNYLNRQNLFGCGYTCLTREKLILLSEFSNCYLYWYGHGFPFIIMVFIHLWIGKAKDLYLVPL